LKSHECREPSKKYTTPQFSQWLSRRGCVAQIECMSVTRTTLNTSISNVLNLRTDSAVLQIRIAVQNILRNRKTRKRAGCFWKCFITLWG
jgi:hypothetical protein